MYIPDLIIKDPPQCVIARNIITVSQLELHMIHCNACQLWLAEMEKKYGELSYKKGD